MYENFSQDNLLDRPESYLHLIVLPFFYALFCAKTE